MIWPFTHSTDFDPNQSSVLARLAIAERAKNEMLAERQQLRADDGDERPRCCPQADGDNGSRWSVNRG